MGWANKLIGYVTGNGVEVSDDNRLLVTTGDSLEPTTVGSVRDFSENDPGFVMGAPRIASCEVDEDFRYRTGVDLLRDEENFCYTSQNTGKHTYSNTTMTNTWAVGAMSTNGSNIVTTTTATSFGTYAYFPIFGTNTLAMDIEASFSAAPVANTVIDFGAFLRGAANPYAPTDGAYFRLTASGLQGVINYNGTETTTSVFKEEFGGANWSYVNSKKYQFILYITPRKVQFWINDDGNINLFGELDTPAGNGQPCASCSLPFSVRHAITGGAAGGIINFQLARYNVRTGGALSFSTASTEGNRLLGSYQGHSGGTMGTAARVGTITTGNEANVTAAVPTTTTAALGTGLGGTFWETATLALNTDGIIMSFQVPAGTASVAGRRLVLRGLYLSSYVQTVIAGGPFVKEWFLAFGHTAVSLGTAEAAATKAPRRVTLPIIQTVTAAQAVSTALAQNVSFVDFGDAPIFVNPGEFVALCTRHIGTVGTAGTIVHRVLPVYGWE